MPENQEEKLRQEILGDAKLKAERIIAKARNDAEAALKKAIVDAENNRLSRLDEAKADAENKAKSIRIEVQRETRRHWLLKREQCLDDMFASALDAAEKTGGQEHEKSMRMLAEEAIAALGQENMIVSFPETDAELVTEAWLKEIAEAVFGSDNRAAFKLAPSSNVPAGLLFTTVDGRKTFDNTYASRLLVMKDDLRLIAVD